MSGEVPTVTTISIEPRTLNAGQTDVTISVRVTSTLDVSGVFASNEYAGTSLLLEQGGNPRSGVWTGTLSFPPEVPDGNCNIRVSVEIGGTEQPNAINIGNVLLARSDSTGTDDRLTTFTFRGPITVQNTTSESGECEIRISVRGPVTIDCENKPILK